MRESRTPAVFRGLASSTIAIFVALAGHVAGGGQMPGPLGILVPWVLSVMICIVLAGKKLSLLRLGVSVGLTQFLFHLLFVLGTVTPSGATSSHVHGAPLVLPAAAGLSEAVAADGSMWAGHLFAAVLTIGALHWGERLVLAVRALAAQAKRWVRRRAAVDLFPREPRRAVVGQFFADERGAAVPHLAVLRGRAPPALLAS